MPGLQSFCVTVAIGLASIYILQITWFTAWLSLDQRRIDAGKNYYEMDLNYSQLGGYFTFFCLPLLANGSQ